MLRYVIATALLALSESAYADTYVVECTSVFPECSKVVNENLSDRFAEKYPASVWKIVVPTARVFRMGNGNLQAYFDVAIAPRAGVGPDSWDAYSNFIRKLKKKYASSKNGKDVADMGRPEFEWRNGEMFEDAKFRSAGLLLMTIMAREATQKMMVACANTVECDLYEP